MIATTASYVLSFTCHSASGQVARFSALLESQGCYIDELAVFDDPASRRFFVRCVFHPQVSQMLQWTPAKVLLAKVAEPLWTKMDLFRKQFERPGPGKNRLHGSP